MKAISGPSEWGMYDPYPRDLKLGVLREEIRQNKVNRCWLITAASKSAKIQFNEKRLQHHVSLNEIKVLEDKLKKWFYSRMYIDQSNWNGTRCSAQRYKSVAIAEQE